MRSWESEGSKEEGRGLGRSGARRRRKDACRVVRDSGRVGGREFEGRRAQRALVRRWWRVSATRSFCLAGIFILWVHH